jgi:hypothetical protein
MFFFKVYGTKVLRKVFVPNRQKRTEGRETIYQELHNLYPSPNINQVIETRRMRQAEHVAHVEERRNIHRILVRKLEKKEATCKT